MFASGRYLEASISAWDFSDHQCSMNSIYRQQNVWLLAILCQGIQFFIHQKVLKSSVSISPWYLEPSTMERRIVNLQGWRCRWCWGDKLRLFPSQSGQVLVNQSVWMNPKIVRNSAAGPNHGGKSVHERVSRGLGIFQSSGIQWSKFTCKGWPDLQGEEFRELSRKLFVFLAAESEQKLLKCPVYLWWQEK